MCQNPQAAGGGQLRRNEYLRPAEPELGIKKRLEAWRRIERARKRFSIPGTHAFVTTHRAVVQMDFASCSNWLPPSSLEALLHGRLLSIEAKARAALPVRADPIVGNELSIV
jgi:hypothetical protein